MRLPVLPLLLLAAPAAAADPVEFNRDVRPILSDACFKCHGFDPKARKAKLRLDVPDGAFAARPDGTPVVPGDPARSTVWERITSTDPDAVMPPADAHKPLTAAQKATIRAWIEQGAKYQKHWAFEPIRRPAAVPGGGGNPIDAFVRDRLRKEGLTPQPEADRETLVRRVAFALTGLPPTVAEVDAFLADKSPDAYERMVDRYLASPRYGEEMARHWLDVARYADTHGLHLDNERTMWAYRDWVVRAFNQNLPFDKFTVWQVAGDLMPDPTPDQVVATGFNRCNVTTSEGGAITEEFQYRYAVERTAAVAEAWLGLTAGCAVCHDHKYDPISAKEFYSLYAFFNNAADPAMDGNVNNTAPFYRPLTPAQRAAADAAAKAEAATRAALDAVLATLPYAEPAAGARKPVRDVLWDDVLPPGASSTCSSRNPTEWVLDPPFGAKSGRRAVRQASAVGYRDTFTFALRPVVVPHDAVIEVWLRTEAAAVPESVSVGVDGTARKGKPATGGKTVTWTRADGRLLRAGAKEPLPAGEWVKLAIKADDLGVAAGQAIKSLTLSTTGGVAYWDALAVTGTADAAADPLESFAAWRKAVGTTPPADLPGDLHAAVRAGDKATPADVDRLRTFWRAVVARPAEASATRVAWEQMRTARILAEEAAAGTFVFRDRAGPPRESFVMLRGQYDKPGEKVRPDVPAVLPRLPQGTGRPTRLDLANWLVAKENPLTARVAANRLWQQFFGTGLVKTASDFGTQGEPPTHPELLDWLASEYRDSGWDVKRFVRLLVTSATFRQRAVLTPEVRAKDPANRLLARGPRFRLDAEQLRDNALFVSNLIDLTVGGRGVNSYQPANVWEPVGYSDSNTRYYLQDHGPALYRRSLYVFLKRTAPPPFMSTFDGPNREQVCTARERTNTPLQALQLMNDTQHFEAARALAERALADGGTTADERVTFLYRTVLSRRPDADERRLVLAALEKQLALYRADPAAAAKAVRVGESKPRGVAGDAETGAWTMVANLILNLDETVCRN
jgi:hypothetical protein